MIVKHLGPVAYDLTLEAMRAFTAARDERTPDEIWLCEHPPVFTQGIAGERRTCSTSATMPVVRTDRGGQVTYHGPGQVVAYPLVDLRRLGIYVKEYVFRLEQALLKTLEAYGVDRPSRGGRAGRLRPRRRAVRPCAVLQPASGRRRPRSTGSPRSPRSASR